MRGPAVLAGVLVLLALAGFGLVRSAGTAEPASREQVAHEIASSLRCPTCQGLSVADSGSPLAQSMLEIINEKVAANESPDDIRGYFVDRYGDWILLSPPARNFGWLVWAVPVLAVGVGLLVSSRLLGRRRFPQPVRWGAAGLLFAAAVGVLLWNNFGTRGEGELPTGNVPAAAGTPAPAQPPAGGTADLEKLKSEVARQPQNIPVRLALASAALQAGQVDLVHEQCEAVLRMNPNDVDALLLRGLSPTAPGDPDAVAAMRKFLELAPPEHPGIPVAQAIADGAP